ncbi:MAG: dTDP-4-dehydrorhamnose reductase [Desulfobacterales bacterium]|nr:dTDP-4-dehydrorhamnose reductase [Desulfobacterales bacterium]
MKVLILGENGQLGRELLATCPHGIEWVSCDFPRVDFLNPETITQCLDEVRPRYVINGAAYTAVDQAESEPEKAHQINHHAVAALAGALKSRGIDLIHVSTDFVFNGRGHRPYTPDSPMDPISVYGASKAGGERAVLDVLGERALIVRTAWLYACHGKNFVHTMLGLMGTKSQLRIVDDQLGTPTWARGLAQALWICMERGITGVHHWTDAGVASWYDFSVAIHEEARAIGLLDRDVELVPVPSFEFPTPARRPSYSVLDKASLWRATEISPRHWRTQLRNMLMELKS